jgi:hypothetical protein
MKRCRHIPVQIVCLLAECEKLLGQAQRIGGNARRLEITESTWHCWRNH